MPHSSGACDALAGTGHALEAKPSCHLLVALQIPDLRVNFLWQFLSLKGEGGLDSALDRVPTPMAGLDKVPASAVDSLS